MAGADGFDAVVVGSGPNGLVGAVILAEAGLKVLLVEQADEVGGGLRSGPLTGLDGFTHDLCATVLPLARASAAFRGLDLGLDWAYPPVQAAHPLDGQDAVLIHRDVSLTADGLGSRRDAIAWRQSVGATASGGFGLVDSLLSPPSPPSAPLRRPGTAPSACCRPARWPGSCSTASGRGRPWPGWRRTPWSTCAGRSPAATGCCWPRSPTRSAGRWSAAARPGWRRPWSPGWSSWAGWWRPGTGCATWPTCPTPGSCCLTSRPGRSPTSAATGCPPGTPGGCAGTGTVLARSSSTGRSRPGAVARPGGGGRGDGPSGRDPRRDRGRGGGGRGRPAPPATLRAHRPALPRRLVPREGRPHVHGHTAMSNGSTVDMTAPIEDQVERFAPGFRDLIIARSAHDTGGHGAAQPEPRRRRHRRRVQRPRAVRPAADLSRARGHAAAGVYLCSAEHAARRRRARHGRLPRRPAGAGQLLTES